MNLLDLCKLAVNNKEKCNSFIININFEKDVFFKSLSFSNFFIYILLFSIFFFLLKKLKILNFYNKYILIFISLNFSLFLFLIIIYPSNIPFTDTWQEINYLINLEKINYFMESAFGHPFFGFRLFHYIIYKYFSLNYSVLHLINFIIFFFSCLFLFFYLNKFKNTYLIFTFLLILFTGKWLNILLEPVNIAWTINFILTISFIIFLNFRDTYFKFIILSLTLFLATSNFGAGFALFLYMIIYVCCINKAHKIKILFLLPILLSFTFLLIFKYINPSINVNNILDILNTNLIAILKNYFGLSSSVYFPYVIFMKPIYVLIGLIQNLIVLYYVFLSKKNYLEIIKNLVVTNPLLIIGILGCLLIALRKADSFEQIRYFSFSIFFQLGFFIIIYKNNSKIFLFLKKKIFLFLIITSYFISIVGPNTGWHFAVSRAAITDRVNKCIIFYSINCNKMIYDSTFYMGKWYNYLDFESNVSWIKKNKLSFLAF
jgi:hypothetical protein